MAASLPILHIRRLVSGAGTVERGEFTEEELAKLGHLSSETDLATPGVAGLFAGAVPVDTLSTPVLFLTEETRPEQLGRWYRHLGAQGHASVLACTPETFGPRGDLSPSDLPVLTGHGVVLASRGLSGEPMVGLELGRLRHELEQSREQLSALAGYDVRLLAPEPAITGRALDGLVRRESERAGYTICLEPGNVSRIDELRPEGPLEYRTVRPGDTAEELRDWMQDRPLARSRARLRRLVSKPGEIFDRLVPKG